MLLKVDCNIGRWVCLSVCLSVDSQACSLRVKIQFHLLSRSLGWRVTRSVFHPRKPVFSQQSAACSLSIWIRAPLCVCARARACVCVWGVCLCLCLCLCVCEFQTRPTDGHFADVGVGVFGRWVAVLGLPEAVINVASSTLLVCCGLPTAPCSVFHFSAICPEKISTTWRWQNAWKVVWICIHNCRYSHIVYTVMRSSIKWCPDGPNK